VPQAVNMKMFNPGFNGVDFHPTRKSVLGQSSVFT
jgi:hypothetical protein